MRHDLDRLIDIAEASKAVARFIDGFDLPRFLGDDLVQSAVVAKLTIIGEAARNLSSTFTAKYSEVPWAQIVGTRNRITHGYDQVDWRLVWTIASANVPELLRKVEAIQTMNRDAV